MLHAAVGAFLDSVTEREFDPTLLALLAAQGFHDIHFIHGAFEFGKDVIAKRVDPATGIVHQYAIQSKAGNIGQSEWRQVRPQLEEAEYNTRAHPHFDPEMPRVAVLLLTGRLKGSAPTDAQEFAQSVRVRGLARVEFWDQEDLTGWLVSNPTLALVSVAQQHELQRVLSDVRSGTVDEPTLEFYTRRWTDPAFTSAAIEGAMLVNALRDRGRLDLAALCAAHLFRGARVSDPRPVANSLADSARRLFGAVCVLILESVEPLLDEPADLVRADSSPTALISYAATTVRITELLALAALTIESDDERDALIGAVVILAQSHPGAARPISDQFAVSLLPITIVLHQRNPASAVDFVRTVATWLMKRSDPDVNGLGLGTMDEAPRDVVARLLGGTLESTTLSRSRMSYVLTVLLDLCLAMGAEDLFADVLTDANLLGISPSTTTVVGGPETFRRAGGPVRPIPHIDYTTPPSVGVADPGWPAQDTLLLVASCRSRHYVRAVEDLLADTEEQEG